MTGASLVPPSPVSAARRNSENFSAAGAPPLLLVRDLFKTRDDRPVLRGISFALAGGEMLGIAGENGAGKTTLIKILCGAAAPDSGELVLDGAIYPRLAPMQARDLGIATVHQDLMLARNLTAAANIFMGQELRRAGPLGLLSVLDEPAMEEAAREQLAELGMTLADEQWRVPVRDLSGGQRQAVALARAIRMNPRILLLDEPIAALDVGKRALLSRRLRSLADEGAAILVTAHDPDDLDGLADRVLHLRSGRFVS
jgi:simple sugar transport system ATP-binding protein